MSTRSPADGARGDRRSGDRRDPPDGARSARGVAVVVVAVVLGVLLLPSATRAPLTAPAGVRVPATTSTTRPVTRSHSHSSSTTTVTVAPSTIHVLVANATTTNGVAGAVTSFLGSKGFSTLSATNALTRATSSQIYAIAGAQAGASTVARALSLPAASIQPASAVAPVSSTAGANVVVIAGADLAARFVPSASATSTG